MLPLGGPPLPGLCWSLTSCLVGGELFILFRKHFFLFKEESEVLRAGKNAGPPCAAFRGAGGGVWPPRRQRGAWALSAAPWAEPQQSRLEGRRSALRERLSQAFACPATAARWGCPALQWEVVALLPAGHSHRTAFAEQVPIFLVPGGLPCDTCGGHALLPGRVLPTSWSHSAHHLHLPVWTPDHT